MTETLKAKKYLIIDRILKNDVYLPESDLRTNVANEMLKLSLVTLKNLELILTFRVHESNELCRQVDAILAK